MQFKQGQNREQMFMTSMSEWVAEDSWARIGDRLRCLIIEPIFGIFKRTNRRCSKAIKIRQGMTLGMSCQWDLDYTLLRGSENVITEYRIAGLAYNLMRLVSVKGLNWVKLRLKKLLFFIFGTQSPHGTLQLDITQIKSIFSLRNILLHPALYREQKVAVA